MLSLYKGILMTMNQLKDKTTKLIENPDLIHNSDYKTFISDFINALNKGIIRAAEKDKDGNWITNIWVKQGILLLFKYGNLTDMSTSNYSFFDKDTIPTQNFTLNQGVRIVPGGSSIRDGAFVAKGVICMPPMYINIGAYIDEGTMIDSHSLVGTCAQIGKNVHISAAAQIGGVLEPPGANPVIIEDNVMIGGNSGIYEGIIVRKNAVIATGTIMNASTKVYDIVNNNILQSTPNHTLEIPENAVVVQGARKINGSFASENGLSISTPIIIKYRDEKTSAKVALEEALR